MRELTCICCPRGCRLTVDEENGYKVTGFSCERGEEYGRSECQHPVRTLTSSVPVDGGDHARCSVKTNVPIPKEALFDAMKELRTVRATAPIHTGDVLLKGIAGTEADIVAGRDVKKV